MDDVVVADGAGSGVGRGLVNTGRLLQSGHSAWWTDEALDRGTALWGDRIIATILALRWAEAG